MSSITGYRRPSAVADRRVSLHLLVRHLRLLFIVLATVIGAVGTLAIAPTQAQADSGSISPDSNGDYVVFGGRTTADQDTMVFYFSGSTGIGSGHVGVLDVMHIMKFYDADNNLVGVYNSNFGTGVYKYHDGELFPHLFYLTGNSYTLGALQPTYGFFDGLSAYNNCFAAAGAVTMEDYYAITVRTEDSNGNVYFSTSVDSAHRWTPSISSYY